MRAPLRPAHWSTRAHTADSCVCAEQRWNLQPWTMGVMLQPQGSLPSQDFKFLIVFNKGPTNHVARLILWALL